MNDQLTFETAIKLAEAGFPKPTEPEFGQLYYSHAFGGDPARLYITKTINRDWTQWPTTYFAPTAIDILRELQMKLDTPERVDLIEFYFPTREHPYYDARATCGGWHHVTEHSNAAEAAAELYLKLKPLLQQ